jgi:hypothetical protein
MRVRGWGLASKWDHVGRMSMVGGIASGEAVASLAFVLFATAKADSIVLFQPEARA